MLAAAPAFADPALVVGPAAGPDRPPAGRPLLDELFPEGLPYPFEAVLARLRGLAGDDNVETALIPLGRSLQRYAASPDYFASPRIVVAVTGDRATGPADPRLADRLFLGYQPAAEVIEAISYNAEAGRFEFQEIVGYAPDAAPEPAERAVCLDCHQGQGPIFPRPLWTETNANPEIAARLAPLGNSFHGAPVAETVDALDAFDAATDRAGRVALANFLWSQGCPDPSCRAALLVAALRLGLTGMQTYASAVQQAFETDTLARWPEGLATVSPDLPNRDPLIGEDTDNPEATGALDPEAPRPALPLWRPGPGSFAAAAEAIAAQLSPGDFAWIDARLRRLEADETTISLPCTLTPAAGPSGGTETRFRCEAAGTRLEGYFSPDRPGRLALELSYLPRQPDVRLDPGGQPAGRTAQGRRIAALSFAGGEAQLTLADDLGILEARLATHSAAASPALVPGPFPRAAVLELIEMLTGATDG